MYKGLILKIKKHSVIVLTDQGEYIKINKKNGVFVGQKIFFLKEDIILKKHKDINKKLMAFAATAAMVLIMIFSSNLMTDNTFAVISIDINPSIDIRINESQEVIEIIALNGEANDLISEDMNGKNILYVIDEIIKTAEEKNYLTDDNNQILISAAHMNDVNTSNLSNLITSHIEDDLVLSINAKVIYIESDEETALTSLETGVSLGRLEIAKITDVEPSNEPVNTLTTKVVLSQSTEVNIEDIDDIYELETLIAKLENVEYPNDQITKFLDKFRFNDIEDIDEVIERAEALLAHGSVLTNQLELLIDEIKELDNEDLEITEFLQTIEDLMLENRYNNNELAHLKNQARKLIKDHENKHVNNENLYEELEELIVELEEYYLDDPLIKDFLDQYATLTVDDNNILNLRNQADDHLLRNKNQHSDDQDEKRSELFVLNKLMNKLNKYKDQDKVVEFIDFIDNALTENITPISKLIKQTEDMLELLDDEKSNNSNNKGNSDNNNSKKNDKDDRDDDDDNDNNDDNNNNNDDNNNNNDDNNNNNDDNNNNNDDNNNHN